MSPLPATPNLNSLVAADNSAVTAASSTIAAGAAAAAKLAALQSQLSDVLALQTQYTNEMNDGTNSLTTLQTNAAALATSPTLPYAAAIAAITTAAPGGLNNVPWKAAVSLSMSFTGVTASGLPGSVSGAYTDFAGAKATADSNLLAKQNVAISRSIDVDTARQQLDAALTALTNFIVGVEGDLANATQYFDTAKLLLTSRNYAGAWWSWFLADALVTGIDAEDDSALLTTLNQAVEKWSKAVTDSNTANSDVATALAAQVRANYNLGIADGKVRAALASTSPV